MTDKPMTPNADGWITLHISGGEMHAHRGLYADCEICHPTPPPATAQSGTCEVRTYIGKAMARADTNGVGPCDRRLPCPDHPTAAQQPSCDVATGRTGENRCGNALPCPIHLDPYKAAGDVRRGNLPATAQPEHFSWCPAFRTDGSKCVCAESVGQGAPEPPDPIREATIACSNAINLAEEYVRKTIGDLRAERDDLRNLAEERGGEIDRMIGEIRALREQLAAKERECVAAHEQGEAWRRRLYDMTFDRDYYRKRVVDAEAARDQALKMKGDAEMGEAHWHTEKEAERQRAERSEALVRTVTKLAQIRYDERQAAEARIAEAVNEARFLGRLLASMTDGTGNAREFTLGDLTNIRHFHDKVLAILTAPPVPSAPTETAQDGATLYRWGCGSSSAHGFEALEDAIADHMAFDHKGFACSNPAIDSYTLPPPSKPAEPQGTRGRTEFAWVIEIPQQNSGGASTYWDGRGIRTFHHHYDEAVRFARKEDAERVREWILAPDRKAESIVTEHGWFTETATDAKEG